MFISKLNMRCKIMKLIFNKKISVNFFYSENFIFLIFFASSCILLISSDETFTGFSNRVFAVISVRRKISQVKKSLYIVKIQCNNQCYR